VILSAQRTASSVPGPEGVRFNGHTREQFVELFHQIGADRDNRAVILIGSGDA